MAVGGIGSSYMSSYFNYSSSMNQLRLQLALQKNPMNSQAVTPVERVSSYNGSRGTYSASDRNFLKEYNSAMSGLMQSANTLRASNSSGVMNDLTLGSSDASVLTAESRYGISSVKDLTVDVEQIAKAQMNQSGEMSASAKASSGMDFSITSQKASGGSSFIAVYVDAKNEKGVTRTNREVLTEAARQINLAKGDVQAGVIEKDGQISLRLTGKSTGAGNTFEVKGDTGAAEGLDRVSQVSQDAKYSVTQDGRTQDYTSSGNQVSLDYGRVNAALKSEGSASLSPQRDSGKIISAVENLVKSYNNAVELLGRNMDRGPGVTSQLRSMVGGIGSAQAMEKAGITQNDDGTLSFHKEALAENLKKEPKLVDEMLSGQNGIAQAAYSRASSGLQMNSSSLFQNSLNQSPSLFQNNLKPGNAGQAETGSYQFLNAFSKAGVHNLSNFMALGLMVDYLA